MQLWVAGRKWEGEGVWEILGIYDEEGAAVERCYNCDAPSCFVGPMTLNEDLPNELVKWEGSYFVT